MKSIKIYPTSEYPSEWDDLIDLRKRVIATIYGREYGIKEKCKIGITRAKDGIYDIVVQVKEINNKVVQDALGKLSEITKKKYKFESL